MKNEADNKALGKRLRIACGHGNVRLTSAISFSVCGPAVIMRMNSACLEANMQDNEAAFEGWALALKRWLPEITRVEMGWSFAGDDSDPHYQRFLYRAGKFVALFGDWFVISPANLAEFVRLKTAAADHKFLLNTELTSRTPPPAGECDCLGCAQLSEHKLECHIVRNQEPLCGLLGIDRLERQLPVGVFRDRVSSASDNVIFPRIASAIDLWGVSRAEMRLFLFELKKRGRNKPLGIVSELFFYACVMADVQAGRFRFDTPNPAIEATTSVAAYILAPEWHPLIDGQMLGMVNAAFKRNGLRMGFGAVKIEPAETEKYRIVTQA